MIMENKFRQHPAKVYRELRKLNPEAYVVCGFEWAYIGHTVSVGGCIVAVYDYEACLEILASEHGYEPEEAEEYMLTGIVPCCSHENSPIFVKWSSDLT